MTSSIFHETNNLGKTEPIHLPFPPGKYVALVRRTVNGMLEFVRTGAPRPYQIPGQYPPIGAYTCPGSQDEVAVFCIFPASADYLPKAVRQPSLATLVEAVDYNDFETVRQLTNLLVVTTHDGFDWEEVADQCIPVLKSKAEKASVGVRARLYGAAAKLGDRPSLPKAYRAMVELDQIGAWQNQNNERFVFLMTQSGSYRKNAMADVKSKNDLTAWEILSFAHESVSVALRSSIVSQLNSQELSPECLPLLKRVINSELADSAATRLLDRIASHFDRPSLRANSSLALKDRISEAKLILGDIPPVEHVK